MQAESASLKPVNLDFFVELCYNFMYMGVCAPVDF